MFVVNSVRMFLIVVWLTSAVDKLRQPGDGVVLVRHLGWGTVPAYAIRLVGIGEMCLAAWWVAFPLLAAIGTIAVLCTYTMVLAPLVAAGAIVKCACGGLLGSEPVSRRTLVRNGALIVAAVVAAFGRVSASVSWDWANLALAGASIALGFGAVLQLAEVLSERRLG